MPLNSIQKRDVVELQAIIGSTKKDAESLLRSSNWDVQVAANKYFTSHAQNLADVHGPALNKLFDKYRGELGEDANTMYIDATMKYLEDLGIPLDSITVLIFFTILDCKTMGEVPRDGFVAGWAEHEATTVADQQTSLKTLTARLKAEPLLGKASGQALGNKVYKHTFQIALPAGSRAVPLDMATEYWKLLFSEQAGETWNSETTPWLDWYIEFLQTHFKKSINRDLWNQTLRFAQESIEDEQMSFWSEEGAWPGVIDDFVVFVRERRKNDPSNMETD